MLHRREENCRPPAPCPPPHRLGVLELLTRLRRNPLECWSEEFFHEPIAKVRLPFLDALLVHDPQAIKRVLMDNAKNYPKDKIQRRILSSGLADGLPLPVIAGGLDDPGVTLGPIVAALGDQPDAIAVPLEAQAIAVVFDLVKPVGASRNGLAGVGKQNSDLGIGRI